MSGFLARRAGGCMCVLTTSAAVAFTCSTSVAGTNEPIQSGDIDWSAPLEARRLLSVEPAPSSNVPVPDSLIVFTANQNWLSRIYFLRMDGSVYSYYQYDFYRFTDVEIVNNVLYAAEAFAPRVYRVDALTGGLEVFIDDWSLYVFYDVTFDSVHFYVNEWDLNRYDTTGSYTGTASFDDAVFGAAWDGSYYWTVSDSNRIKCWDLSEWPSVVEIPENAITPPTPQCRGLWYDGTCFWTAESLEGVLGKIYQFDHRGRIVRFWTEPAYSGWAAAVITFYVCGDVDGSGAEPNVADLSYLVDYLFLGGPLPPSLPAADVNGDSEVNVADLSCLVDYLFHNGIEPDCQ